MPSRLTPWGGTSRWLSRCSRSQTSAVVSGGAARSRIAVNTTARSPPRSSSIPASRSRLARSSSVPDARPGPAPRAGVGYHTSRTAPALEVPARGASPSPHAGRGGGGAGRLGSLSVDAVLTPPTLGGPGAPRSAAPPVGGWLHGGMRTAPHAPSATELDVTAGPVALTR